MLIGGVDTEGNSWYYDQLGVLWNISKPSSPPPLLNDDIEEEGNEAA